MSVTKVYQKVDLFKLRDLVRVKDVADVIRRISSEPGIKAVLHSLSMPPAWNLEPGCPPDEDGRALTAASHAEHVLRSATFNASDPPFSGVGHRSASFVARANDEPQHPAATFGFPGGENRPIDNARIVRNSPTPSTRRGRVAKLLRDHGSPPGIRVTAGGRIVPDGMTPLGAPQYLPAANLFSDERFMVPNVRSEIPHHGLHPLESWVVTVGDEMVYQVVNGMLRQVGWKNSAEPLRLYAAAPNVPVAPMCTPASVAPALASALPNGFGTPFAILPPSAPGSSTVAPASAAVDPVEYGAKTERQYWALKEAHASASQQLKALDREEVLQRSNLNTEQRKRIADHRVALTIRIDEMRKARDKLKEELKIKDNEEELPGNHTRTSARTHAMQLPRDILSNISGNAAGVSPILLPGTSEAQSAAQTHAMPYPFPFQLPPWANPQYVYNHLPPVFFPEPSGLQEQPGKAAPGLLKGDGQDQAAGKGMNLDGSVQQPRRSHAIEIKRPHSPKPGGKMALNPRSPAYEPTSPFVRRESGGAANDDAMAEHANFFISPRMAEEVGKIVDSPDVQHETPRDEEVNLSSSSTANTSDLFPSDPLRHSSTRYVPGCRQLSNDMSVWMQDASPPPSSATLAHVPTKYMFADSPQDCIQEAASRSNPNVAALTLSSRRPSVRFNTSSESIHEAEFSREDSEQVRTKDFYGVTEVRGKESSTSNSPTKSDTYWHGFGDGIREAIPATVNVGDYFKGYREGMAHRRQHSGSKTGTSMRTPERQRVFSMHSSPASESRASSMPSCTLPAPPTNSLVNTPLRGIEDENGFKPSPLVGKSIDSAYEAFSSKPNINLNKTRSAEVTAHGSGRHSFGVDSLAPAATGNNASPLARRYAGNQIHSSSASSYRVRAAAAAAASDLQLQQRHPHKVPSSVAHAAGYAIAHVVPPARFDGSSAALGKKGTDMTGHSRQLSAPPSPSKITSPVRRATSLAIQSLGSIAGARGNWSKSSKDQSNDTADSRAPVSPKSPSGLSSPDKAKWRANMKWGRLLNDKT